MKSLLNNVLKPPLHLSHDLDLSSIMNKFRKGSNEILIYPPKAWTAIVLFQRFCNSSYKIGD